MIYPLCVSNGKKMKKSAHRNSSNNKSKSKIGFKGYSIICDRMILMVHPVVRTASMCMLQLQYTVHIYTTFKSFFVASCDAIEKTFFFRSDEFTHIYFIVFTRFILFSLMQYSMCSLLLIFKSICLLIAKKKSHNNVRFNLKAKKAEKSM